MFLRSILHLGEHLCSMQLFSFTCFRIFDLADNASSLSYRFKEAVLYFPADLIEAMRFFRSVQFKLQRCLFHRSRHLLFGRGFVFFFTHRFQPGME